ncbi:electron transport complex protein rnfC, partial [Klebsiella sp. 4_1_44FAA]
ARKAEQQAAPVEAPAVKPVDPRQGRRWKPLLARAKARKAEQQAAPVDAPAAEPVDPRKAAVEAATRPRQSA